MHSFTANEAKTQFGEMINKALREPISITKNGKATVVVMSVDDFNAYENLKLENLRIRLQHSISQANAGQLHDGDQVFDELIKDL